MTGIRFSANTGFLWQEMPFPDRIRQAAAHGFAGVEFHDEAQVTDRSALRDVLAETQLPVYSLNTRMGRTFGCAAIPGQEDQAKRDIDHAIEIASDIGAAAVHILGGVTAGPHAYDAYLMALDYALDQSDLTFLIEPISNDQLPGFFLHTIDQGAGILSEVNHPRLKILFDCYHVHCDSGNVLAAFRAYADKIGHVQIAAAENRAEPFPGALNYSVLLNEFQKQGYSGPFGCEYRPAADTGSGLGWRGLIPGQDQQTG